MHLFLKTKKANYKRQILSLFFVVVVLTMGYQLPTTFAATGTPSIIGYQGRLTDASGNLLGGSGTTYYFKFSIWDDATVGNGNKLWPLNAPGTVTTTVREGVFNVNIGDTVAGYPDTLNYNFNTNRDVYLQVEVSSNGSSFETLSPRQRISSASFAQLAGSVSGIDLPSSFGTTTPIGNSAVTIEASSTTAVPLSIRAALGQAAKLFDVQNSSGLSLFYANNSGGLFASSTLGVTGLATFFGGITSTATATSTYSGAIRATCFSTDGVTCITGTGGTGISAIGPTGQYQSGSAQTLATSTTGTDFTITASSNTISFNLPTSSSLNRGLLQSADYISFSNKLASTSLQTSALLASLLGDETGSGSVVFSASPTLSGFTSNASSTIGSGAQDAGLTISGGATTTGNFLVQGSATSTNLYASNALGVNGQYVSSFTGTGLSIVNGVLTATGGTGFSTTSANYWSSLGLGFATSSADAYRLANNFYSTTSADYWKSVSNFYSTTSANYWSSVGLGFATSSADAYRIANPFSTTSANYWSTLGLGFATSSASAFSAAGLAFSTSSADAYRLANNFYSTTSADYWKSVNNFYSTSSANYWSTLGLGFATSSANAWSAFGFGWATSSANAYSAAGLAFATTSSDYWKSVSNFFSTTSANYFASAGLGFSTTSVEYWKTASNFYSTTSADYWKSVNNFYSTTSEDYYKSVNNFFSTTSADYYASLGLAFSTTSADAWRGTKWEAIYPFINSATSSLLTFSGGLLSTASTTIGAGGQTTGLTISGGATTTGNLTVVGNATSTNVYASGVLGVNGQYITSFTGTGLSIVGGALTASGGSGFSTTSADYWKSVNNFYSTTSEDYYKSVNNFFSTSSADFYTSLGLSFSTTSANAFAAAGLGFSTSSANGYVATKWFNNYPFPSNATTTTITFSGGVVSVGSTTLNGNATTTGTFYAGTASSSQTYGSGLATCSGSNFLQWSAGVFGCSATAAGSSFSTSSAAYWLQSGVAFSTTTNNTWTGANIFQASTTIGDGTQTGGLTVNGAATTTGNLTVLGSATTTNFYIAGALRGAGLTTCSGSSDKLLWNSATGLFTCGADAGAGGGITALGVPGSYQTGSTQTFATSSDVNFGLTITSSGNIHTFSTTFSGTLADARVADNLTISGGTIENTPIGAATPSTATFTNASSTNATSTRLYASTVFGLGSNYFTNLVGSGLANVSGALSIDTSYNFFSSTSASYFLSQNLGSAFSTTSSDYWKSVSNFFSTTSASYFSSLGLAFSTTSTSNFFRNGLAFSTTTNNTWTGGNIFAASTTIGDGTSAGGLTINGGATTTGLSLFSGGYISQASSTVTGPLTITGTLTGASSYFTGGVGVGVSTTTPGALQTSGSVGIGSSLSVSGNVFANGDLVTLGNSSSDTLNITSSLGSHIIPKDNTTYDLGSSSFYWRKIYVDNVVANSISAGSSNIAGTASDTFTINSDNATADAEDASLIFYRGSVGSNGVLKWNSTAQRFEINKPTYISGGTLSSHAASFGSTATSTFSSNGALSLVNALTYGGVTLNNGVTGTGYMVLSNAPTFTGTTTITDLLYPISGLVALASSTIGGGTQTTGLTIFGGATTTGDLAVQGSATSTNLYASTIGLNSEYFTDLTGTGLLNVGGVLTLDSGYNFFSTTSADIWKSARNFFSTTSANYWSSIGLGFATSSADAYRLANNFYSTTSADYWKSVNNFYSTTSANYWSTLGLGFATSSANAWSALGFGWATSSANAYSAAGLAFATTSSDYWKSVNNFYSTSSANYWSTLGLGFSTTSSDYYRSQKWEANYPFPLSATSSLLTFTGGLISTASTTINRFDALQGTTTNATSTNLTTSALTVNSERFTDLTGYGLSLSGGALTVDTTNFNFFSTSSANYWSTLGLGFATSSADAYRLANNFFSTSSANYWSTLGLGWATSSADAYRIANPFSTTSANYWSTLGLGFSTTSANYWSTLGLGFATSSANAYSAAGLAFSTTSENYYKSQNSEFKVVGNSYLTPTSTIQSIIATASSTLGGGATTTGLTISGGATTTGQHVFLSNIGIGTTSPWAALTIATPNLASGSSTTLFLIASSTASATTTLFSVSNTGSTTIANGININAGCFSIGGVCLPTSVFSTTSASYFASLGLAFSTTSEDYYRSVNNFYSTSSANYWSTLGLGFATSSANAWSAAGLGFSTTSENYYASLGLSFSTSSANGYVATKWFNNYPFPNNATSTGLGFYASTTIGAGGQTTGLTINGGATTTGTAYFAGLLGVGTSSPTQTFSVNGNSYFAGNITIDQYSSYKLGGNTVLYASTTNGALAVGASAAAAWMSASSTAWNATAIGIGALGNTPTNAASINNTAIGANALSHLTTGANNTAIGKDALYTDTTGSDNFALGTGVLYYNNGDYNVGIGSGSLANNAAGSNNVSIGRLSLQYNTVGANNIAIGSAALNVATSSSNNTAIGHYAGGSISGATGAVGAGNTLIGYQAGSDITKGAYNTVLGFFTGAGSSITTGSNNILIGQDVRSGLSQTGDNQLNIGNLLFGTGLGSGTTLAGSGSIGIGTSSPASKFSVQGDALISGTATAGNLTATSSLTVGGTASTTNLTISSLGGSAGLCLTITSAGVVTTTSCGASSSFSTTSANYWSSLGLGWATSSADAYRLANNFFSTTSANYWSTLGLGFATSSANAWSALGLGWATSSADAYRIANPFSTSSANAWSAAGLGFATSSANYWSTLGLGFATSSANAWSAAGLGFSTTSANTFAAAGLGFSTTSENYYASLGLSFSTSSANGYVATKWFNNYPFPNNATSTGLGFYASTTIGAGGQTTGLTINGGATTTGNAYVAGSVGVGVTNPAAKLSVLSTTEQMRLNYDASNYSAFTAGSNGSLTVAPTVTGGINLYAGAGSVSNGWAIGGTDIRGLLTLQKSDTTAYAANTDVTDSGRTFVMENTSTSNAANQFANITLQINPTGSLTGGRVLGDLRLIRQTANQSDSFFLLSAFRQDGTYKDFAKVGYDSSYFVGNLGIGTTTPSKVLAVQGNALVSGASFFGGAITATSSLTVSGYTGLGTSSPYARLSLHANPTDTTIATSLFAIASSTSNSTTTLFSVDNTGAISMASGNASLDANGNLTVASCTGCGGGSSFSTTSANYWSSLGLGWATSSADAYRLANNFYSTSSANYWSTLGLGFATSSANAWSALGLGWATSSADAYRIANPFSTTSANYWSTLGLGFSTTSANAWSAFGLGFSTSSANSYVATKWFNNYPFPNNATSTGLGFYASTTIGAGGQTTGLTINGGATTTGNAYFAGNVGIGTTSPGKQLSIVGTDTTIDLWDQNVAGQARLWIESTGGVGAASLIQTRNNTPLQLGANSGTFLTIEPALGHVGIFTSNPQSRLDVNDNVTIGGSYAGTYAAPANGLIVQGITGIGTTSPYGQFSIEPNNIGALPPFVIGSSTQTLFKVSNTGAVSFANNNASIDASGNLSVASCTGCGAGGGSSFSTTSANYWSSLGLGFSTTSASNFFRNGLAFSTTTNNTWTGSNIFNASTTIGNGTGAGGLTISGNATTTGNAYVAGTSYLSGNVGINTRSPSYGLDITATATNTPVFAIRDTTGAVSFSIAAGTSSANNLFLGTNAGLNNGSGSSNIAIGADALRSNQGAVLNLAIGSRALYYTTEGGSNAGIGYEALFNNTLGSGNVAIGSYALHGNIDGNNMTAIGYQALYNNNGGSSNVAIGANSLYDNVNGGSNTAVGQTALQHNTDHHNSAFGTGALQTNINGYGNSAFGSGALNQQIDGQQNVGMGYYALYGNSGGDYNVALGTQAGYDTTGNGNVILGGWTSTGVGITSGSNNILIGRGVRSGLSTTSDSQLNIGNLLFGTNIGIDGALATGQLGVGTSSPYARLSVHANDGDTNRYLFSIASSTASATTTLFSVSNTGAVSFASGNALLDASGNLTVASCTGCGGASLTGTTGQVAYFTGTNTAAGTSSLNISTAGFVGIGTSSPFAQFAINTPFLASGANRMLFAIASSTSNSTTTLFSVDNIGNAYFASSIGIGTSTPYAPFSILATTTGNILPTTLFVIASSSQQGTTTPLFVVSNTGNVGIGTSSPFAALTIATPVGALGSLRNLFTVASSTGAATTTLFNISNIGLVTHGSFIANASSTIGGGATTTGLTITGGATTTGNAYFGSKIGIGTTTPLASLTIVGGTLQGYPLLQIASTSLTAATFLNIDRDGRFMVGTSTRFGEAAGTTTKMVLAGGSFIQQQATGTVAVVAVVKDSTNLDSPRGVTVSGKYAYMANSNDSSLRIIDIADPKSPVVVGGVKDASLLNQAYSVAVSGRYAYVAALGDDSLRVVDISNPSNPVIVGGVKDASLLDGARSVVISGKYAYVAASNDTSVRIIDISNPAAPVIVGGVKDASLLNGVWQVAVSGSYVYAINNTDNSIRVIDVSNPTAPFIAGGLKDASNFNGLTSIFISGKYAYVAAGSNNSFDIVDISNPITPALVSVLKDNTLLSGASAVYAAGKYAYVGGTTFLRVIDISTPSAPVIIDAVQDVAKLDAITGLAVSGRYAFVTSQTNDSLATIDLGGMEAPAANIGALFAGSANISDLLTVTGAGLFNSINIGDGGIFTNGGGSFTRTATTSLATNLFALAAATDDNNASGVSDVFSITHTATGTIANGIGSGLVFGTELNVAGAPVASTTATSTARIASILTDVTATTPASALTFYTKSGVTDLLERMRLSATGNLGVGSTSPFAKLSVQANNGETNRTLFAVASSTASATTTLFSISNTGAAYFGSSVGIGTTTPAGTFGLTTTNTTGVGAALDLTSITSGTGVLVNYDSGAMTSGGRILAIRDNAFGTNVFEMNEFGQTGIRAFGTLDSASLTIGTGFDTFKGLSIRSNSVTQSANLQEWQNASGIAQSVVNPSGFMGVGTSSPFAVLSVNTPYLATGATRTLFAIASSTSNSTTTLFSVLNTGALSLAGGNASLDASGNLTVASCLGCSGGGLSGTFGQFAYFSGTNTAVGTSTLNVTSAGLLGLSTSSPFAQFSINTPANATGATRMLFAIGSSTSNSTTTLFSVDNTGAASTTKFYGSQLSSCTGANALQWNAGIFTCANVSATGSIGNWFSLNTTYNSMTTTTLIGFVNGIYTNASSTIGSGGQAAGLTINGGATTTGVAKFVSNASFGTTTTPTYTVDVAGSVRTTDANVFGDGSTVSRGFSPDHTGNSGFIGNASFQSKTSLAGITDSPSDVAFDPSGMYMYVLTQTPTVRLAFFQLITPYNVASAPALYSGSNDFVIGAYSTPEGFTFSPDGKRLYITDLTNSTVYQYSLPNAWFVSNAQLVQSKSVVTNAASPISVRFKPDGLTMYVSKSGSKLVEYRLTTPWDISTATYFQNVSTGYGTTFTGDGYHAYLAAGTGVYGYQMSTPWAIATFAPEDSDQNNYVVDASAYVSGVINTYVDPFGTRIFLADSTGANITVYNLAQRNPGNVFAALEGTRSFMGVGTSTNYGLLTVSASASSTAFNLFNVSSTTETGATTTLFNIDRNGTVTIGTSTPLSLTNAPLQIVGEANSYLQANIQNMSAGGSASSDWIATSNIGTDSTYYLDLGINSSGYNDANYTVMGPNDAYLYSQSTSLSIGIATSSPTYALKFFTGGTLAANERMRIDVGGNVGIGTTTPKWTLQVASSTPYFAITDTDAITNSKHWLLSAVNGIFRVGTSSDTGFGSANSTSTLFTIDQRGFFGFGSSSPFAFASVLTNRASDELAPAFIIATSSNTAVNGQSPLFWVGATTTGALDYSRVAIGTTSPWGRAGLRDQFTVGGRIYSTWRSISCDFPGAGFTANVSALTPNYCGGFSIVPSTGTSGSMLVAATNPFSGTTTNPMAPSRMIYNGTAVGSGISLRSYMPFVSASSSPVFEAQVTFAENTNSTSTIVMIGFDNLFGTTIALGKEPTKFIGFIASSTVGGGGAAAGQANWIAVLSDTSTGGLGRTQFDTGVSTTSSLTGEINNATTTHRFRIEVTAATTTFLIDNRVVAVLSTTTPVTNLSPNISISTQSSTGLIVPKPGQGSLFVSLVRLWVDDPVDGGASSSPGGSVPFGSGTPADVIPITYDWIGGSDMSLVFLGDATTTNAEMGTLVSLDTATSSSVRLSSHAYDSNVVGALSRASRTVLGSDQPYTVRVAISGRTMVNVSAQNGAIAIGDPITTSDIPGVGMKATRPGYIIGRASEAFDPTTDPLCSGLSDVAQCQKQILVTLNPSEALNMGEMSSTTMASTTSAIATITDAVRELTAGVFNKAVQFVSLTVGKLVTQVAVVGNLFAQNLTLLPGASLLFPSGENQLSGASVMPSGATMILIHNTKITKDSKVFLTPKTALTVPLAVTELRPGVGFVVSVATAQANDAPFDWLIVGTQETGTTSTQEVITGNSGGGGGSGSGSGADTEAPSITLNGANPAEININDTYSDLGAVVTDNVDASPTFTVSLDGATSTPIEQLHVDTSVAGTHSIVFSSTDQAGNTSIATRTVHVGTSTPPTP